MGIRYIGTHVRARNTDPDTSHAAGEDAEDFAESLAGRIYEWMVSHGRPAICSEIAAGLDLTEPQVNKRLPELHREQMVLRLDETRPGSSGRHQHLWDTVERYALRTGVL